MTLVSEYNRIFTKDPRRWSSFDRDEMVFNYIKPYGVPKNILEIGCGNGHLLAYISARWPDIDCVGLDFSEVAINLAKQNAPKAKLICVDIEDYKPKKKFDMVLLSGVAEHFDNPLEKLKLIQKLVAKNGILYLEVPNCISYSSLKEKREGYFRISQGTRQMEWHLYRESWEKIIEEAEYKFTESLIGSQPYWEFVWILSK